MTDTASKPTSISIQAPKIIQKGAASASIIGMLAASAILGVVGAELKLAKSKGTKATKFLESPFLILAGTTMVALISLGFADFGGEIGESVGKGLAGLVLLFSALEAAGSVWTAGSKYLGAKTGHATATGKQLTNTIANPGGTLA